MYTILSYKYSSIYVKFVYLYLYITDIVNKTEIVLKMIVPLISNNRKSFLLYFIYSIEAHDLLYVFKMHVTLISNNGKSSLLYFTYSI